MARGVQHPDGRASIRSWSQPRWRTRPGSRCLGSLRRVRQWWWQIQRWPSEEEERLRSWRESALSVLRPTQLAPQWIYLRSSHWPRVLQHHGFQRRKLFQELPIGMRAAIPRSPQLPVLRLEQRLLLRWSDAPIVPTGLWAQSLHRLPGRVLAFEIPNPVGKCAPRWSVNREGTLQWKPRGPPPLDTTRSSIPPSQSLPEPVDSTEL